jgi:hypothetical protein
MQVLPAQQPAPTTSPQGAQLPRWLQASLLTLHEPMQQASPGSPQWWQVSGPPPFGSHEVMGSHGASTPLLQQRLLSVPQATH